MRIRTRFALPFVVTVVVGAAGCSDEPTVPPNVTQAPTTTTSTNATSSSQVLVIGNTTVEPVLINTTVSPFVSVPVNTTAPPTTNGG